MVGLIATSTGLTVYLAILAGLGYYCGEAPGGLQKLMSQLRGEQAPKRRSWLWAEGGQLNRQQRLSLMAVAGVVLAVGGALFFHSVIIGLVLACAAPLYPATVERTLRRKHRALLTSQFGLALQVMAASLRAGASLRTAIERAAPDLDRMLAGQPLKPMVAELRLIIRDLEMGFSLEDALVRFRDRVNLEDVTDFVGALQVCRVRGGNAAAVMASISEIIEDKISVQQQILAMTAGKRAEGNMMTYGPPALVVLMGIVSPDYMQPFYTSPAGVVLFCAGTACLVVAFLVGRKLTQIEV